MDENTIVTTNEVVKVDYIEGEYEQISEDGFKKRLPNGYDGSSATKWADHDGPSSGDG